MIKIWTVLRSGGIYTHEHVNALARNLRRVDPDAFMIGCVADTMPPQGFRSESLIYWANPPAEDHWRGWWMKMNIFSPAIDGDVLYCDLDTVFVGSIEEISEAKGDIVLRDFFKGGAIDGKARGGFRSELDGHDIGSGFMRWSDVTRMKIWRRWIACPEHWMELAGKQGDQRAIQLILEEAGIEVQRWQDLLPGAIVSYKADCVGRPDNAPPESAAVVCMHGKPKQWELNDAWAKKALS